MTEKQAMVIDLDAMAKPVARIKVFGFEHDVLPMNGRCYEILQGLTEKSDGAANSLSMEYAQEIVHAVVPTLEPRQIKALNAAQLINVIAIASKHVDAVKKVIDSLEGNVKGPARKGRRPAR